MKQAKGATRFAIGVLGFLAAPLGFSSVQAACLLSAQPSMPESLSPLSAENHPLTRLVSSLPDPSFSFLRRSGHSDRQTLRIVGTYSVPVPEGRSDLAAVARFPVDYKLRFRDGTFDRVSYDLPLELTGLENEVELAPHPTADNPDRWTGGGDEGSCANRERGFECRVAYKDLKTDVALAEDLLRRRERDPLVGNQRVEVMRLFVTEPCGVLELPGYTHQP